MQSTRIYYSFFVTKTPVSHFCLSVATHSRVSVCLFWPYCIACGISVPRPKIEPTHSALDAC